MTGEVLRREAAVTLAGSNDVAGFDRGGGVEKSCGAVDDDAAADDDGIGGSGGGRAKLLLVLLVVDGMVRARGAFVGVDCASFEVIEELLEKVRSTGHGDFTGESTGDVRRELLLLALCRDVDPLEKTTAVGAFPTPFSG